MMNYQITLTDGQIGVLRNILSQIDSCCVGVACGCSPSCPNKQNPDTQMSVRERQSFQHLAHRVY